MAAKTLLMKARRETSIDDRDAEIAALRAKVAELQSAKSREVRFKVSEKGGVSVYGLGRFPVTLYKEQWRKLFERIDDLGDFIDEHEDELATKEK